MKKSICLPNGTILEVSKEDSFAILKAALAACQAFQELSKKLTSRFKCADCLKLRRYKINSCRRHQVDYPPSSPHFSISYHHRNNKNIEDEENRYRG